ncbi:hypothetical protein EG329_013898 [Mollisiaceae sp. DMI_Dod_QoI]|nr:hypothetical protein EG329_013898 [Helotiales sp. DMI_Dod_QoI]
MDIYDMDFEMEEFPPHLLPQASLELSSLSTTHIGSQGAFTLPQGFPGFDGTLNSMMNLEWPEPHAMYPPDTSLLCPAMYLDSSIMPLDHASAHDVPSFRQNDAPSHDQNLLPVLDQTFDRQQPSQYVTRKRAPKAPTMSAKKWKPHEDRIRQFYVKEGKSIEELREIMNKELGIAATLRQYKVQIQQMKLERNVKANERKAVVKRIQNRTHAVGKKSSHVRIRGHKINQEKLTRWLKENPMDLPSISATPPSPLPSCISIYTNSICGTLKQASLANLEHQRLVNRFMTASHMESTLAERLLKYAPSPKHVIESQEARAVFNDLQLILSNDYTLEKRRGQNWNPSVKEDIIQVRNLMNVTQGLFVSSELKGIVRNRDTHLSEIINKHAAWTTPYGKVQASFWASSNDSNLRTRKDATRTANKTVAARMAFIPSSNRTSLFRVVFDFVPHLNPSATITYQTIIPNDSKVFKIVRFGEVEELIELLENGTASLTDRDEEGRSLLNYATFYKKVEMCKFLVDKKADVNAMELDEAGFLGPIYIFCNTLGSESEVERHKSALCIRISLEAGADFSLEIDFGGFHESAFIDAIDSRPLIILKHMLDFGESFINLNGIYKSTWRKCSALTLLAHRCGYSISNTMDVVDKAILLLNRKADISCRDEGGDTVLHTLLKCRRLHERTSKTKIRMSGRLGQWNLSFKAPKDLLMVFLTAGADVYATNDYGETPSMVASRHGRVDEWIEALELCGYDAEEVISSCIERPTSKHQTTKLSFQEYCQQRQPYPHPRRGPREDVKSEDSDDDEEIRVIAHNTGCVGGGENPEISGEVACADYGMDNGLDNEGKEHTYTAEEMVDHQVSEIADNVVEGMGINLDDYVDNEMDIMQSIIHSSMFSSTPFK